MIREKILNKSAELFLNYGFKSVTMDDIANQLGISKKTIYQHFENKTKLVEAATMHVFNTISHGINCICAHEKNPIEEVYDIKNFVMEHLKDEKSSPQYQLQKYYPRISANLKKKQFEIMYDCVQENLKRGIRLGYYRDDLNVEFITRIYFNSMMSLKDQELFPIHKFSMKNLMHHYVEYHLYGICTPAGLEFLKTYKSTTNNINQSQT